MSASLWLHGKSVTSVFELLGDRENDMTYSLGWALAQCPEFRARVVASVIPAAAKCPIDKVRLQEHGTGGITDIELVGDAAHIIIEAKRGFEVPGHDQLGRYALRLNESPAKHKAIVTVSESSQAYASTCVPRSMHGVGCQHRSLADIDAIAKHRAGTHAEKRLLGELSGYFNRIAKMQDLKSNTVYVVVLSGKRPSDSTITFREIVEKHGMYFHPVGNAYPKEPVNYIGFRFDGQLQFICHVDKYEVVKELGKQIPGCRHRLEGQHYLYTLGPQIKPNKRVANGKIVMANRVYAALDLLLTCDTISQAGELTRQREGRG